MDNNILKKTLFLERYNDAVDYLETNDQMLFSYNRMSLDKCRNKLNSNEMQFIIDLAESVRFYSSLKPRTVFHKKTRIRKPIKIEHQKEIV